MCVLFVFVCLVRVCSAPEGRVCFCTNVSYSPGYTFCVGMFGGVTCSVRALCGCILLFLRVQLCVLGCFGWLQHNTSGLHGVPLPVDETNTSLCSNLPRAPPSPSPRYTHLLSCTGMSPRPSSGALDGSATRQHGLLRGVDAGAAARAHAGVSGVSGGLPRADRRQRPLRFRRRRSHKRCVQGLEGACDCLCACV